MCRVRQGAGTEMLAGLCSSVVNTRLGNTEKRWFIKQKDGSKMSLSEMEKVCQVFLE